MQPTEQSHTSWQEEGEEKSVGRLTKTEQFGVNEAANRRSCLFCLASSSLQQKVLQAHSLCSNGTAWQLNGRGEGGGVDYFEIESQNVEREPLKPGNMSYNLPRAINDWWKLSGSRRNHKAQDTYDSIIHISFTHSGTPPGVPPACFSLISHSTQCFYAFICKYINFSIIFCLILFLFYSHISLEPPTISRTAKPPIRAHLHQEPPSSGDSASSSNVK